MRHLSLREALASDQLDAFVREQEKVGAELASGSELERGLALLTVQRFALAGKATSRPCGERQHIECGCNRC